MKIFSMKISNEGTFSGQKFEQIRTTRGHMAAITYSVGNCQYIPIQATATSAAINDLLQLHSPLN